MSALYSWNVFSVQVVDIKKLLGSKATVDQQLRVTFRKSLTPPLKNHSLFFTHPPKNSKSASTP